MAENSPNIISPAQLSSEAFVLGWLGESPSPKKGSLRMMCDLIMATRHLGAEDRNESGSRIWRLDYDNRFLLSLHSTSASDGNGSASVRFALLVQPANNTKVLLDGSRAINTYKGKSDVAEMVRIKPGNKDKILQLHTELRQSAPVIIRRHNEALKAAI